MPHRALRIIRDGLLGLAYPQQCRVCGDSVESWDDGVVCAGCWADPDVTRILTGSVCAKCGAQLDRASSDSVASEAALNRLCGTCSLVPFSSARACGVYSGAFEASILSLKVSPHICPRLRKIIISAYTRHESTLKSEVVVPIPLHRVRERERGFNQATVIARVICREFGLTFDDRTLSRTKPTERHRAGMDADDRSASVEQAFEVVRPGTIEDASVLLVDDVYTTGSTLTAATRSLIAAGASRVNILTIARVGAR